MGEKKIDHGLLLGVVVWITICVLILAAAPVFQLWLIKHWVGLEGFKEYIKSINPAFYQFIITIMGVLAAVAGYLTYKSRQEAMQEVKEIQAEMEEKKEELKRFGEETRRTLQETIDDLLETKKKFLEQTGAEGKQKAEEKVASIDSIQLPVEGVQLPHLGETDKEREARIFFKKGMRAFKVIELDTAIELFTKAIQMNPSFAKAYFYRGVAHVQLGKSAAAIEDFVNTVKFNPDLADAVLEYKSKIH
jgi:tetratricopeptide (TPR) repeat protein